MGKVYVGIDPGKTGAVAVIVEGEVMFTDYPHLNLYLLGETLYDFADVFVLIEAAQAMPGQGSVSGFHYGQGYGEYLGMLKAMQIPFETIHPTKWKKEFGLLMPKAKLADKKRASRDKAIELFPKEFERLSKAGNHGRAEALLLAEYARRHNL
jgi:hypothetical protein